MKKLSAKKSIKKFIKFEISETHLIKGGEDSTNQTNIIGAEDITIG